MSAKRFYWIGDSRIVPISSWREDIAWYCSAEPDDLDLVEACWGGPEGDENSVDLVTHDGVAVGTLDRMITHEDLSAIALRQASLKGEAVARTQLSKDSVASIESAAKPIKKPRKRKRDRNQGELLLPILGGVADYAQPRRQNDEQQRPAKNNGARRA
jgi:hypothetical protein